MLKGITIGSQKELEQDPSRILLRSYIGSWVLPGNVKPKHWESFNKDYPVTLSNPGNTFQPRSCANDLP